MTKTSRSRSAVFLNSFLLKVVNTVLNLVIAICLARVLGTEGYGEYAFAISVVMILSLPAQFGLPQLVIRATATAKADHNWDLIARLWGWSTLWATILSLSITFLFTFVLVFLGGGTDNTAILICIPCLLFIALTNLRAASLRGLGHVVVGQIPVLVIQPLVLLLSILSLRLFFPTDHSFVPENVLLSYGISFFVAYLFARILLQRYQPSDFARQLSARPLPSWTRAIIPLAAIGGLQLVNTQTDLIVLGFYRENEEVGIYRAVIQLSGLIIFGLAAVLQILQPRLARLHHQQDLDGLQRTMTLSARLIAMVALPIAFVFALLGGQILAFIFGPDYASGALPLIILSLGQLVNAGAGAVAVLLNMTGYERETLKGTAVSGVLNIVLNIILVPDYGAVGAAAATAISLIVWNVFLWRSARHRLGIDSSAIGLKRHNITRSDGT